MPTPDIAVRFVASQAGLDEACAAISQSASLPIDTEFARTDTFRARLCLIQVGTPAGAFCIDTLAGLDLAALWQAIAASGREKVMHAAKQDIEVLLQCFGAPPGPLFDTQVAAGLLGHPPQAGYASLVEAELGLRLDKSQTRTDWTRRPLTPAQVDYAANDVAWLPELAGRLRQRLVAAGRESWALEDSAALLDPGLYSLRPERAWERLGGLEYLPAAVQARARRLAAWREQRADDSDRPRQWILADAALMALAAASVRDAAGLEALGLPPGLVRNSGAAILAELDRADAGLADGLLPAPVQQARPAPADNGQVKRLAAVVQKVAGELGIAPEILATRGDLAALLRGSRELRPLRGWRRAIIGDALLAALP
ncbi:Ribonuclease D [Gammaproteobacteria bacterium]|nr:ribonuclease D [Gammaproteobacteria bacterium]CAG0940812.1 Ribonuclease D [Gammaproteobacteria bacterium]